MVIEADNTARCSNSILLRTMSTRRPQCRYTQCPDDLIDHSIIILHTTPQKPTTSHRFTTAPGPRRTTRHCHSYLRTSGPRSTSFFLPCHSNSRLVITESSTRQYTSSCIRSKTPSYPLRYYLQHHPRPRWSEEAIAPSSIWKWRSVQVERSYHTPRPRCSILLYIGE